MKLYIIILFIFYIPTFVLSQNIPPSVEFFKASAIGDYRYIDYWLSRGGSLDIKDRNLNTPLMLSAENGHLEFILRLLNFNIDINSVNSYGYTPLLSALVNNHKNISLSLFEKGASPYITNIYGTNIFSYLNKFGVNTIFQYFNMFTDVTPNIGPSSLIYLNSWEKDYLDALYTKDFVRLNLILENISSLGDDGDVSALRFMAIYYLNNNMTEQAENYLLLASKKGDHYSSYLLNNITNIGISSDSMQKVHNNTEENIKCDNQSKDNLTSNDLVTCGMKLFFKEYNFKDAYSFFHNAYSKGDIEALYYLGIMKYYGIGTEENKVGGYIDIKKASINGINKAVEQIDRISTVDALNYLKNYKIIPRYKIRAFLISQGAIFSTIGECDNYNVKNYFASDYGIENIRICYCFDDNCAINMTFFLSSGIDNLYNMFIKGYSSTNLVELSYNVN